MYRTDTDNDLVECPFDKTHRVLRKRLQPHLYRCSKQHPDVELRKCPFNTTHLIPESEYMHHTSDCPDRKIITQYKYIGPQKCEEDEDIKIIKNVNIDDEENWDDSEAPDFNLQSLQNRSKTIEKSNKEKSTYESGDSSRREPSTYESASSSRREASTYESAGSSRREASTYESASSFRREASTYGSAGSSRREASTYESAGSFRKEVRGLNRNNLHSRPRSRSRSPIRRNRNDIYSTKTAVKYELDNDSYYGGNSDGYW